MFKKHRFLISVTTIYLFFINSISAQTGSVRGVLMDSSKRDAVMEANVVLSGTVYGSSSGISGTFRIENIKAGTYKMEISHQGYVKYILPGIRIEANGVLNLDTIWLKAQVKESKGFTVRGKSRKTGSETAVLDEVKKAESVANAIGEEEIGKSQAGDAGKAAAKVPGVTLMESRFVILRGLSQRYNSVVINGVGAPSTEPDRRAFSFDLVPSSMLDKMMIFKSPSPDLPGDFAGGAIKIYTRSAIVKSFAEVSFNLGYRFNTTFVNHESNNVSNGTDLLGMDLGKRNLSNVFPSSLIGAPESEEILAGKQLNNNYQLKNQSTPVDFGIGAAFGNLYKIGKKNRLYNINSLSYSTSYQYAKITRNRYQNDLANNTVQAMFDYDDNNFSAESKFSLMSNWIFQYKKNNTISLRNLLNQIGENETTVRTGTNRSERPLDEFKNYGFHYTSRTIYGGQLEGIHKLNKEEDQFSWVGGLNFIRRNEPDFRRFKTSRAEGSNSPFYLLDPPSASTTDAARFYSDLMETSFAGSLNYLNNMKNPFDSSRPIVFKTGVYGEMKNRDFRARWFGYVYNGLGSNKQDYLELPIDELFAEENINDVNGVKLVEGTNPTDKYTAGNSLAAAYAMLTLPMNRLNVSGGLRYEFFHQHLESENQNGPVVVDTIFTSLLPSLNASLYLTEKTLIRLAYGRTVNRPEFRELAPFLYYDFNYDVNIEGNPNLKMAVIDNLDLRYEIYPTAGETYSLGVFYKKFQNPIENYVRPLGLSQQFYMANAKSAENFGAEIEIRKSLNDISSNKFIQRLSVIFNASYIYSAVDLGDDTTLSQDRNRALQGQSPYILNAVCNYFDEAKQFNVNLSYNIFGKRIAFVGNNIFPTAYELWRHSLDLTITKELSKKWKMKLGIADILNSPYRVWQDTNSDEKIDIGSDSVDKSLMTYRRGQYLSLGFSYIIK